MFYTYIIFSPLKDKYYIGASENPIERLKKHNSNHKGFTNQANDWEILFIKQFELKDEAFTFEKKIKSWKSRKKIEDLVRNYSCSEHPDENFV